MLFTPAQLREKATLFWHGHFATGADKVTEPRLMRAQNDLLRQLGDSVKAFLSDLEHMKQADQVVVMAFSEFGRRVAENASEGTDHGAAGPMFVAGAAVCSGLIGKHPDLNDLQEGDLKHHTDFRQVYATLIEQWFSCDSSRILKANYAPLPILKKG